jgi:hypothetical protein
VSNDREASPAMNDAASAPDDAPISISGCLQNGDRGSFIVTEINSVSQPSVGSNGTPEAVGREQMRQAAKAYRVDPKGDIDLESLVGKQVSVRGTVEERADLPQGTTGTTASADRADSRDDMDQGDLAKIEATSVSMIAEQCGAESSAK